MLNDHDFARALLEKALEFGADLAGFAAVENLKNGPSETLFPNMKDNCLERYASQVTTGLPFGSVKWEAEEKTLLVFALRHPEDKPHLDWWFGESDPPGNRILARIASQLRDAAALLRPDVEVWLRPYAIEKGGLYLKEAAVAAGLGCIGKNNLLVTPQFGPRVRLRAIGLSLSLPQNGPSTFDPCADCSAPCRAACPREAFRKQVYTHEETGLPALPARDGTYFRLACNGEMDENVRSIAPQRVPEYADETIPVIRYCRACEFACVVGK